MLGTGLSASLILSNQASQQSHYTGTTSLLASKTQFSPFMEQKVEEWGLASSTAGSRDANNAFGMPHLSCLSCRGSDACCLHHQMSSSLRWPHTAPGWGHPQCRWSQEREDLPSQHFQQNVLKLSSMHVTVPELVTLARGMEHVDGSDQGHKTSPMFWKEWTSQILKGKQTWCFQNKGGRMLGRHKVKKYTMVIFYILWGNRFWELSALTRAAQLE